MAKKPIRFMKNRKKFKSGVFRDNKFDADWTILPDGFKPVSQFRGFHLSKEDVLNLLHNLPEGEGFDKAIRFIKSDKEVKAFNQVSNNKEKVKEVKKALEPKKEEVVIPDILTRDHMSLDEKEEIEYRRELKKYAKKVNVNIAPALKDIDKIKLKIIEKLNQ